MKKLSFFMVSLFVSISSVAFAQFSCSGAVPITNGYTASGITTPGTGAGSPEAWVTLAPTCSGGYSTSQPTSTQSHHQVFTTAGDDYVFSYTTGPVAGESVSFEILTHQPYMGLMAFTECNGTELSGCQTGAYSPSTNATLRVTANNLPANQTVYFGVGIWSTPNNLNFDVTNFTVTPSSLGLNETEMKKNSLEVYPNPVQDILNFSNLKGNADVTVFNMQGQKVMEKHIKADETMNVSELISGTYMVNVINNNNKKTFKVLKK
ncbi:hypothetical protein DRF65_05160 [Chryseobacterium pennae]|uniref:Secretion system C-terminal sorting domain-containing protein n=1 Tax=Chryseobacterium pennae TaxID=2258962 RepID=A0A3D9CCL7_9FLAO|nr:T9SS type A sorting domain-containing protein [Chryseobacterium pennae]REC63488.1 hypothetical protein DRF65_05160 [Chryseobacterium pennae]